MVLLLPADAAQTPARGPLEVPARTLPVPTTVSPEMQALIAAPLSATWNVIPKSADEWKAVATPGRGGNLPALRERFGVKAEPLTVNGVRAYMVTPNVIPPENRNRLLVHVHGGCYVLSGGEAATTEAIYMAGFGHFKVLSIDYRRPPEFPYPAALDDGIAAWKEALKMAQPKNMAIFGTSAGGALTLSIVLRAKQEGLPLPGAIAPGTPMSDLTGAGDSFHTNFMVDNVLVGSDGRCDAMARLYANGHDLKDPMLSPVYGDMHGFPPAILTTGTRDLLLSNTVRVHRKLRQAGVDAELQVYEGQSHAHYMRDSSAPETKEAFEEIARFFDRHLGK
ncbi:MAG: alpha/beta hydrolase [Acidobacteria bacterium]|nr:MAG: alpha/beta hydrolase [Acidobacteriota bacterium]